MYTVAVAFCREASANASFFSLYFSAGRAIIISGAKGQDRLQQYSIVLVNAENVLVFLLECEGNFLE